jgi:hypothetical protein
MLNLKKQYKQLNGKKEADTRMLLLASLPNIRMMEKLLTRKQNGKKKFPESFSFDVKMEGITSIETVLGLQLKTNILELKKDMEFFRFLDDTCILAMNEIKMDSLKRDFIYLSQFFQDVMELLKVTESKK